MSLLIEIPVAAGELIDKISILEIKAEKLTDQKKLENVRTELDMLRARCQDAIVPTDILTGLMQQIKTVNMRIWDLEDGIRDHERRREFDAKFVELARAIYQANDERAKLKRDLNVRFGSLIIEEKSYTSY